MAIKQRLTPERLLSAPRRGPAVPNNDGTLAFFTVTTHVPDAAVDNGQHGGWTTRREVALLAPATGRTWTAWDRADGIHDMAWIPGDDGSALLWLESVPGDENKTALVVSFPPPAPPAPSRSSTWSGESVPADLLCFVPEEEPPSSYVAGTVHGPVRSLKLCLLRDGSVACAAIGPAGLDGELVEGVAGSKSSPSVARIYDAWEARESDSHVESQKHSIWYSKLVRHHDQRWKLAGPFQNALQDTGFYFEPSDGPDGGRGDAGFDLGPHGIAFVARNPWPDAQDPHSRAASDVYLVPLSFSPTELNIGAAAPPPTSPLVVITLPSPPPSSPTEPPGPPLPPRPWQQQLAQQQEQQQPRRPARVAMQIQTQGRTFPGRCASPCFSPDGTMLAYLKTPLADGPRGGPDTRLMLGHVGPSSQTAPLDSLDVLDVITGRDWDLRPSPKSSRLAFHPSGESLLFTADDCGRVALFGLPLRHGADPVPLFRQGSASAFFALGVAEDGQGARHQRQLLVSSSSMIESSAFHVVDDTPLSQHGDHDDFAIPPRIVASATRAGARYGLSQAQVSEMYFEGGGEGGTGGDYCVQAWVVRPSDFDEDGKYPVVLMIHDGPVDAFRDEWQHTEWNPIVWAEQGYVVVLPNITGSLGFGLDFSAAASGQWGGRPYRDLANCAAHVAEHLPYADPARLVAAGRGFGGYMINWILGHPPLARRFRALIAQDGVLNLPQAALLLRHDSSGSALRGALLPWGESYARLRRWDPARPDRLENWRGAPPVLVVHSGPGARYPLNESLAAFRALQLVGVTCRLVTFRGEDRRTQRPEDALEWHRVIFEWLGRHNDNRAVETRAGPAPAEPAQQNPRLSLLRLSLPRLSLPQQQPVP